MSIYGTWLSIEDERQWVAGLEAQGIRAGVIRDGDPDFDDLDAPIIYQGSHVLPADSDARGGSVQVAAIPAHITQGARGPTSDDEDGPPHPWLRLDVNEATVVLTRWQVARLRDTLDEWLGRIGHNLPPA